MINKKSLIFVLFLFLISPVLKSQYNPKDVVPLDPSIRTGKLPNGLTYFIMKNKKPEARAELRMVVNAGSICEDDDQKGLAHFCEHMAFNGTKDFPRNELVDYVELIGMQFGADLNAYTNFDETVYMLQVPTDKPEILEKGLNILEQWAGEVSYDGKEIDKERGVITEEWRLGKGAEDRIWKKELPVRFKDSKYALRDVIGDTTIILNAPYSALRRFYKDWYRPDNIAIVAIGDFDVDKVEQIVKQYFSKLTNPTNERKRELYPVPDNKGTLVSVLSDPELSFPNIDIIYKHPMSDPTTFENYRSTLVSRIVSNMLYNRYQEYLSKPNPPFLYAYGSYSDYLGDKDAFNVTALAKGDDIMYSYKILLTELFRSQQTGFTPTEFERQKTDMLRYAEKAIDEKDKTESRIFANQLVYHFLKNSVVISPEQFLEYLKAYLPTITLDEVNKRVSQLITPDNSIICISVPQKDGISVPSKEDVLKVYNKLYNTKFEPYVDNVGNKPLFSKDVQPGKIIKEDENKKLGLTEFTLSNGAKVIVKKTDFKNDQILSYAVSPGGYSLVTDNNDLYSAKMASSIIDKSGLDEFSDVQINKMLTGKIAKVSPFISTFFEGINGSCSPKDFETLMQLINLQFTAPRYDEDAFKAAIDERLNIINMFSNNPESVFQDSVTANLFNYNPRRMPWTKEDLDKVNHKKAFEFYKDRFKDASDFTFIFVGSIDIPTLKTYLEKYIASLPAISRKENWRDEGVEVRRTPIEKTFKKGSEFKSQVEFYEEGNFKYTPENLMMLEALNQVFDIRLREVLREDKGGTYGAYASISGAKIPKEKYTLYVGWGCSPDRVKELSNAAIDIIKELKTKPLDDKYLEKVHETMIREMETNLKDNNYWLRTLSKAITNNEDISYIMDWNNLVGKITAKTIEEAANKYLNEDQLLKFYLFPEPQKN
jgi:zinc protease